MATRKAPVPTSMQIAADDDGVFRDLYGWLHRVHDVTVEAIPSPPKPGQQGSAWEFLSVAFGSGGAGMAALETLKVWLQSRRSTVRIEVTVADRKVVLDANNIHDVLPTLTKMLDDS